jgi:hypothetical protein
VRRVAQHRGGERRERSLSRGFAAGRFRRVVGEDPLVSDSTAWSRDDVDRRRVGRRVNRDKITTPSGVLEIVAEVSTWEKRLLHLDAVHIQGAEPHRVGRANF